MAEQVILISAVAAVNLTNAIHTMILSSKKEKQKIKDSNMSVQHMTIKLNQLNQKIITGFYKLSQQGPPIEKNGKKYVTFIGPTSVGKSTMLNDLFNLNQPVGLGKTTEEIKEVFHDDKVVYFDSVGKNNDWQKYKAKDVIFFNCIDRCFLLYQGQVDEVKNIGQLLSKMGKELIFVRNQCDKYKQTMKSIDVVLQEDRNQLNQFEINYKEVIASGVNDRKKIKELIQELYK